MLFSSNFTILYHILFIFSLADIDRTIYQVPRLRTHRLEGYDWYLFILIYNKNSSSYLYQIGEREREKERYFRLQIDLSISAMHQGKLSGLFKYDM